MFEPLSRFEPSTPRSRCSCSQIVEATHALALVSERPEGFGYLLKDRVLEIDDFLEAVRRVGKGGTAIDPEVIGQLLGRRREQDPLGELTRREREVWPSWPKGSRTAASATSSS